MESNSNELTSRTAAFLLSGVLVGAGIWALNRLGHLQVGGEYSSQTLFIPLLSGYLLWNERKRIFARIEYAPRKAIQIAIIAVVVALSAVYFHANGLGYLFSVASLLSAILLVVASFIALYGPDASRHAVFPFCMLMLAIPFPNSAMQGMISILQAQSAWLSGLLFSIVGIPVYREGFLLTVPGVTIEVARECSGINSSIALVMTTLLVARQSLNSNWRRAVLVLITIPLSILKNAIRITTLTMLALRVDPSFLTGRLHRQGGFVFYLLALMLMYPIWKLLKHGDAMDNLKKHLLTQDVRVNRSAHEPNPV